ADGRIVSALARFRQCIEICDAHGLARETIPNRTMVGHCRIYLMEFDAGLADVEAARALAVEILQQHGEMLALESQGLLLSFCDRHADAEPLLERGLVLAEAIGARRFQSLVLAGLAACALATGRLPAARDRIERSLALSREIGMGFCGPMALGVKARLLDDAHERERCRAEAEALMARGCASHNLINYHRHGIDDALARGEYARGLEHAAALEAYTRGEPLPYCDFLIARARVLIGLASHPDDPRLREELSRLRREADRVRWPIAWPLPAGGP
ncbi:MAG: hypothetical protein OEW98_00860, partial [Betaproteobacteria bacterium]|nr:hypothetical protein [Betaproteobacteria bacterium]